MIIIDQIENKFKYPNAIVVDLTTMGEHNAFSKLSPHYPHGAIPIPNTAKVCLNSVNEVWQSLCVNAQNEDNLNESRNESVKFKKGLYINEYWNYIEARRKILIPVYCWMLENKAYN